MNVDGKNAGKVFVGRQKELKGLKNSMQNALDGKGSVVFIAGEAGSGKTKLINKLLEGLEPKKDEKNKSKKDKKIQIARTDCLESIGDADPFSPFSDIFDELFVDKSKQDAKRIWDAAVEVSELFEKVTVLGETFSLGIAIFDKLVRRNFDIYKKEEMFEKKDISQKKFFSEYTKILQELSRKEHPLVLVIDELQWIDKSSARLLLYLSKNILNDQIFIIGAYRTEEVNISEAGQPHFLKEILNKMNCRSNVVTIGLEPLEPEEVSKYISKAYLNNDFPEEFIGSIHPKTGGNPLFVVELMKLLEEEGIIVREATKWHLKKKVEDIMVPDTIEGIIEWRINKIRDETDRKLHDFASVEGREFTSDILSELLSIDRLELSRRLRIAREMYNLIEEAQEKSIEIGSYHFINSFTHHGFYDHLGTEERILLHRKIGETLESKCKDDNETKKLALTLADHFVGGRIPDKALKYLLRAAKTAEETNSFTEALRLYEKTNKIIVENRIGKLEERVRILTKLGEIYRILGRGEEAIKVLEESLELSEDIDDELVKASCLAKLGIVLFYPGKHGESRIILEEALKIYEDHEDILRNHLKNYGFCLQWLGISYRNCQDLDKAMRFHQKALEIATRIENCQLEAHAIANIGAVYLWDKKFSKVTEKWKKSLEISEKIDDLPWVAHFTIDVGYMHFLNREYEEAKKYLIRGIKIARKHKFEENYARGMMNLGSLWFAKGNLKKARILYERALNLSTERKIAKLIWRLQHNIGNICRREGEYEKARKWYLFSIEFLEKMISAFRSEDDKEGFLNHRLDPFRSMILLCLERQEEDKALEFARRCDHESIIDFLEQQNRGINLTKEEEGNLNFFDGYYIVTE
ncbi:MAG: tetratricopeptide repeat protein [Theionarchaea archaeon]|nr:tetratricopeptide repeat protein [Theionarchaea archaeon]